MIGALLVDIVLFINWAYLSPRSLRSARWCRAPRSRSSSCPSDHLHGLHLDHELVDRQLADEAPEAIDVLELAPYVDPDASQVVCSTFCTSCRIPTNSPLLFFAVDPATGEVIAGGPPTAGRSPE